MAKATGNVLISGYKGRIGSIDRTVGRDGGQMLNFIDGGQYTILGKKPLMPQTKSPGRQARTAAYCSCDEKYRMLSQECRNKLQAYQISTGTRLDKTFTPFQFFMGICLRGELCAFKKWTGCETYGGGDCPIVPVVGTTYIDRDYPNENYSGSWEAWVDTQNSDEPDYPNEKSITLIELATTAALIDLHIWSNWAQTEGIKANIHRVAPFNMESVTWNTQPERYELVGELPTWDTGWNWATMTNPGKYISIDQKRIKVGFDEFLRVQYFTEEEGEYYRPWTQ